ncbi:MAG TPA: hypothetical protein VGK00_07605 [Anaerolineales bacterium]
MSFEAEFYTYDHVIKGVVETPQERLSDYLNWKNETSIVVHNARISRLLSLGKSPPILMHEARVEKHSILFALPVELDMTTKSLYRRTTRLVFPVGVILPNFELIGSVHLTEKIDIHRVLLSKPEDFIPLTNAFAVYSLYPAVAVGRSTLIFNKNRMILIGEHAPPDSPFEPAKPSQPSQQNQS